MEAWNLPVATDMPLSANFFNEALVDGFGKVRWRGIRITGSSALAAVSIESKLRHDKHFFAEIQQRTVHFSLFVIKDPQMDNLVGHPLYFSSAPSVPWIPRKTTRPLPIDPVCW